MAEEINAQTSQTVEYSTSNIVHNLSDLLDLRIARYGNKPLFRWSNSDDLSGEIEEISAVDFQKQVNQVAKYLLSLGVSRGSHFPYIASVHFETLLVQFAALSLGAIAVPIYPTASQSQISHILETVKSQIAYAQNSDLSKNLLTFPGIKVISANDLKNALENFDSKIDRLNILPHEEALIIFTSGTTALQNPNSVSHNSLVKQVLSTVKHITAKNGIDVSDVTFHLPLAHIMPWVGVYYAVYAGSTISLCPHIPSIGKALGIFKPTWLLTVPKVVEKAYSNIVSKKPEGFKGLIFDQALKYASSKNVNIDINSKIYKFFDGKVYEKIRSAFGGRLTTVACGGQKSSVELQKLFFGLGINYHDCYGMTEAHGVISLPAAGDKILGTVGKPLEHLNLQIQNDGEIVLKDFYTDKNVDRDLKTGDLGEFTADGELTIIGRKKDIIITSGGKNVFPEAIEASLMTEPLIEDAIVVGENRPFVGVLLWLAPEIKMNLLSQNGCDIDSVDGSAFLNKHIQMLLDRTNKKLSRPEQIRKFLVINEKAIDREEKTPSQKIRREYVINKYADKINEVLYDNK